MRAFATYQQLQDKAQRVDTRTLLKEAAIAKGKTTFLSHSSKDHDLVPGVAQILREHGGLVYVDDADTQLPKNDFVETAARLRKAVSSCKKFVLLVTPRTRDSKWIPWELGLGDGNDGDPNVALFPSAETADNQDWSEQEYLGLYRRILWANFKDKEPEWLVLDHRNNKAITLRSWLSN
jgi:hypothetical protein